MKPIINQFHYQTLLYTKVNISKTKRWSFVCRNKKGYSLVEIVLLGTMIAILTAIALPNFLTAQTQSKVARVKKEMRYIGIALEAYKFDNNTYPWLKDIGSGPNNFPYNDWTWCGIPLNLNTPIGYVSDAIIWDAFPDKSTNSPRRSTYRYMDNNLFNYLRQNYGWAWAYSDNMVGDWVYPVYRGESYSIHPGYSNKVWVLISNGPDEQFQDWIAYDPTNGIISNGDIERFGP